jgi:uncharacterized protein (TIGR02246 family)
VGQAQKHLIVPKGRILAMQRFLLFLLLAFSMAPLIQAQSESTADTDVKQKEIVKVEQEWNRALLSNDTDALSHIFADDLAFTNANGEVLTKRELLAKYRSGDLKFVSISHSDMNRRIYGATAVVTGTSNSTIESHGRTSHGPRRFTNVYVKQDGVWRVVAHHTSNVAKQ